MNSTSAAGALTLGAVSRHLKFRYAFLAGLALTASVPLSGCVGSKGALDDHAYLVGAVPLETLNSYPLPRDTLKANSGTTASNSTTAPSNLDIVMSIANDSQTKCHNFIQELSLAETGSDTTLDIASMALSALSSAFAPVGTKTALSAASTITGGMKTAVDSDFYAKASIANYSKVIQATYSADMKAFRQQVSELGTTLDIGVEYGAIDSIHAECTLAGAQSAIDANLQPNSSLSNNQLSQGQGQGQGQGTATANAAVAGATSPGDTVSLVAHADAFSKPVTVTTTIPPSGAAAADVVSGLVKSVNSTPEFKNLNIKAKLGVTANTVELSSPTSLGLTWDPPTATPPGRAAGAAKPASRTIGTIKSPPAPTTPAPTAKPTSSILYGTVLGQRY